MEQELAPLSLPDIDDAKAVSFDALKKPTAPIFGAVGFLERMTGIEPALPAWEAGVLPMNYIRV